MKPKPPKLVGAKNDSQRGFWKPRHWSSLPSRDFEGRKLQTQSKALDNRWHRIRDNIVFRISFTFLDLPTNRTGLENIRKEGQVAKDAREERKKKGSTGNIKLCEGTYPAYLPPPQETKTRKNVPGSGAALLRG